MSDLVFISFATEQKAEEVRQKVLALQKDYLIQLDDALVVVKAQDGQVRLNQLANLTTAGALSGAMWGALVGLIFLVPFVGATVGAASGAIAGRFSDVGINDQFMKDAAGVLAPGTAGLFLLVKKMTTDKVLADLEGVGGTVLRTSLDQAQEQRLREALSAHVAAQSAITA